MQTRKKKNPIYFVKKIKWKPFSSLAMRESLKFSVEARNQNKNPKEIYDDSPLNNNLEF